MYYLGPPKSNNVVDSPTPTAISLASIAPVDTVDPTANWKTYQTNSFNYAFSYPLEMKIVDKSIQDFSQVILTNSTDDRRIIVGSNKAQEDELPFYPTYSSTGDIKFGSLSGKYYLFLDGYCDSGSGCPDKTSLIAIVGYNNGYRYVFKVYGSTKLNDLENQILSTFKFINNYKGIDSG